MPTKIAWCDETWNPITGCTPMSEGCENCYAKRMAQRLAGRFGYPKDDPFRVTLHPDKLDQPERWRKPRRIFVCSMGDLWHPDVDSEDRADILAVARQCDRHQYLFLTKRPKRVKQDFRNQLNFALGVSVENQKAADERVPKLLKIPAAVKFLSCEPLLSALDLTWVGTSSHYDYTRWNALSGEAHAVAEGTDIPWDTIHPMGSSAIDGLIIGCESGPKRRPCKLEWVESLIKQADAAGVPVFVKQIEVDGKVTSDPADWPQWARRQEFHTHKGGK